MKGPPGMRCAVLVALLAALLAAPLAAAARAPKSGAYTGITSEKGAVSFNVSGRTVTLFSGGLGYNGKCGARSGPAFTFVILSMALTKTGFFTGTATARAGAAKATIRVTGTIVGNRASGTIVEPKPFFACKPPDERINPYSELFSATTR